MSKIISLLQQFFSFATNYPNLAVALFVLGIILCVIINGREPSLGFIILGLVGICAAILVFVIFMKHQ